MSSYFGRKFDAPPLSLLAFDPGICFQHFCCTLFYPWDVISKATKKKAKLYLHLPFERADQKEKKQTNSIQYLQCYTGVCECVRVSSLCTCIIRWSINENQCFFSFCTRSKVVGQMFSLSKRTLKDGVLSSLIPSVGEEEEKRVGPYSSEYCCPTRNK